MNLHGLYVIVNGLLCYLGHASDVKVPWESKINIACQQVKEESCDGGFLAKTCQSQGLIAQNSNEAYIHFKCRRNDDCRKDFGCYNGVCLCKLGFYYSPKENACVKECAEYGANMDIYMGASIAGHNDKTIFSVSILQCCQLCVREESFTCLTIDWTIGDACFLSRSAYLDVKEKDRETGVEAWWFAQRHCK